MHPSHFYPNENYQLGVHSVSGMGIYSALQQDGIMHAQARGR